MEQYDREHRRQHAQAIWQAGVDAVRPEQCLPRAVAAAQDTLGPLRNFERIWVVGGGKAGAAMAAALETALSAEGVDLTRVRGLVNVPDDTVRTLRAIQLNPARPMGINYPTEAAAVGTRHMLNLIRGAGDKDLILCLISGGGSALLVAPVPGVSLADKQAVSKVLMASGATIHEMNAVRKHLSLVKGGGMARAAFDGGPTGRRMFTWLVSDVMGDPFDVIASGPTAVDPTTFADACAVVAKYQLEDSIPAAALAYLHAGAASQRPETLKAEPVGPNGDRVLWNQVVAGIHQAVDAAKQKAIALGYQVVDLGANLGGDTVRLAQTLIEQIDRERDHGPRCWLSGGETTVTLPARHGKGGRNQLFVLAALCARPEGLAPGTTLLSGGTDGEDGPTDAAGAWADETTLARGVAMGLAASDFLGEYDPYDYFNRVGGLLRTGLTHTNVMDLRVILTV
jgi:hydroxypyruvate reductase/glycerate 2-kinase